MTITATDVKEVLKLLRESGYKDAVHKNGYIVLGYWEKMLDFDQTKFFATLEEEVDYDEDCGTLYSYRII